MVTSLLSNRDPTLRRDASKVESRSRSASVNDVGSDDRLPERLRFVGEGIVIPTSSRATMRDDFGRMKEACGKVGSGGSWVFERR